MSTSSSHSSGPVTVTLTRTVSQLRSDGFGCRLQITATGVGVPDEIFLYELVPATVTPVAPATGKPVGITRAYGLAEYPAGIPATGPFPAFFRTAEYDVIIPSFLDVEDVWNELVNAVQELVTTVKALDTLVSPLTVTISSGG